MNTDRFTKALLLVIAFSLLSLIAIHVSAPRQRVMGATSELQFSADKDHFYFFDPATQKVSTYLVTGGHVQNTLELSRSGAELKPVPTY